MNMKFLLPLALLFASVLGDEHCHSSEHGSNQSVKVELANGAIEGYISTSREGHEYEAFEGIPFGKVVKRFADPVPADKWEGVLSAKKKAPACYNTGMFSPVEGSEDCLKLDVYSPVQASSKELLPVMVWIYGGGFLEGATNQYGPDNIMDSGEVVLVMINYRLGAFGFLNTGSKSARGNQGMKDQVLALQWVQENIHHFSGNKDLVTIFGESAGSISVALHVTSPMSKGLFHRAIMQSGTIAMPFMDNMSNGWTLAKKLGEALDCPTSEPEGLVTCLQRIDPKVFGKQVQMLGEFGFNPDSLGMGPSIETYSEGENDSHVFMKEEPLALAESGNFNRVPIVMGLTSFESMMAANVVSKREATLKKLNHQWGRHIQSMLYLTNDAEDPAVVGAAIREKFVSHPEGDKLPMLTKDKAMEVELLISERHWIHPMRLTAAAMAKYTPVFVYNFTLNPLINRNSNIPPAFKPFMIEYPEEQKRRPPSHGDDIPFLFKLTDVFEMMFGQCGKDHEDFEWSKDFLKAWTSFAKTGKFTSSPWKDWSPVKGGDELFTSSYLEIDKPPRFVQIPDSWKENHKFWDSLSLKYWGGKWVSEA